jgi:hypothetical protein
MTASAEQKTLFQGFEDVFRPVSVGYGAASKFLQIA